MMNLNNHSPNVKNWLLKPSVVTAAIVGLCTVICGFALFGGYRQYESARDNALASDKITVRLLADLIQGHQKAVTGVLESYANRPLFVSALKSRDLDQVAWHLSMMEKNHEIDLTFVTDEQGVLLANFPVFPEALGKNLSNRDWYRGISSHWSPYVSTVFKLIVGDKPLASAICVPIFDDQNRAIGVLATSQRLGFLAEMMRRVPLIPYTTVSVLDGSGKILYSNKISDYEEKITDYPSYSLVKQALQENHSLVDTDNSAEHQGKKYLTIALLEDIGWTVVVERTQKDVLQSTYRRFIEIGIAAILLVFLVVTFLFYFRKASLLKETGEILEIETKLRASERAKLEYLDKLNEAQEISNIGSWDWDMETGRIWWSDEMYRIFGVAPSEHIPTAEADTKFIHPEDMELFQNKIANAVNTRETMSLDIRIVLSAGAIVTVHQNFF